MAEPRGRGRGWAAGSVGGGPGFGAPARGDARPSPAAAPLQWPNPAVGRRIRRRGASVSSRRQPRFPVPGPRSPRATAVRPGFCAPHTWHRAPRGPAALHREVAWGDAEIVQGWPGGGPEVARRWPGGGPEMTRRCPGGGREVVRGGPGQGPSASLGPTRPAPHRRACRGSPAEPRATGLARGAGGGGAGTRAPGSPDRASPYRWLSCSREGAAPAGFFIFIFRCSVL